MEQKMYKCQYCTYSSNRSFNLRKHEKSMHKHGELKEIYDNTVIMLF